MTASAIMKDPVTYTVAVVVVTECRDGDEVKALARACFDALKVPILENHTREDVTTWVCVKDAAEAVEAAARGELTRPGE